MYGKMVKENTHNLAIKSKFPRTMKILNRHFKFQCISLKETTKLNDIWLYSNLTN